MRCTRPIWAAGCCSINRRDCQPAGRSAESAPAAAETIENGPASGASAIKNGLLAVASGYVVDDIVLVAGGEKMRE
ncbi:MAG: hypothetical protein U0559_01490 [Anaerolineae bacterium]